MQMFPLTTKKQSYIYMWNVKFLLKIISPIYHSEKLLNVPKCAVKNGITAKPKSLCGLQCDTGVSSPAVFIFGVTAADQTGAPWLLASRRGSPACVNWNQSLCVSIGTLQLVRSLVAMMAVAIDDNLAECINNAKSYMHSSWTVCR